MRSPAEVWNALFVVGVLFMLVGLFGIGMVFGRKDAIRQYREQCIGDGKTSGISLLYADEYRASDCEAAIRLIWRTP